MKSIDEMKSIVDKHKGVAISNRYNIILPSLFVGDDPIAMDFMCRQVTFPGKTMASFERRTNQKIIKVAHGYNTNTVQMLFTETNDMLVSRYFDFWQNAICSPFDYLVDYRDNYAKNVLIIKRDKQDKIVYAVLLIKAWPSSKLDHELGDASQNTVTEIPVSFEYEDYKTLDPSLVGVSNTIITGIKGQRISAPVATAVNLGKRIF